jgi:MFS family permease
MAAFEALAVATILPQAVREIGGLEWYGWAFTGFMLANLVGIPLAGEAVDRRGPALPFLAGVVAFAAGLGVAGFANSMEVLRRRARVAGGRRAALVGRVRRGGARLCRGGAAAHDGPAHQRVVLPGLFGPALAAGVARQRLALRVLDSRPPR